MIENDFHQFLNIFVLSKRKRCFLLPRPGFNASKTAIFFLVSVEIYWHFEKVPVSPISNFSDNLLIPISNFVTWDFENLEICMQEEAVQNLSIRISCSQ